MQPHNYSRKQVETPAEGIRSQDGWCFRSGLAIDIKFGLPRYDCRFHGICKLDVDELDFRLLRTLQCGRAKGWLCIPQACYGLICFDKNSMTEATLATYFTRNYFELPEPVSVSEVVAHRIGRQTCLLPGRYRIQRKGSRYGVLFQIKATAI